MAYDRKDMELLVKGAREAIASFLGQKKEIKLKATKPLLEKRGVFVTLMSYPKKELRGCIGYPFPTLPLLEGAMDAAVQAARDSRFSPVRADELEKITVEVTALSELEQITGEPKEFPKKVKVGRHGLYIDAGFTSGLLLPKVAVEEKWDAEQFLAQTCWKAGLEPSAWLDPGVKVYRFEGQVFAEEKPGGKVVEKTNV